jgi:nucleoid-associated protein YgaU
METAAYIQHRLRISGYEATEALFTNAALRLIAEYSGGIPRNINNICFNSLTIGCALKRTQIDEKIVREVITDLNLDRNMNRRTEDSLIETTPEIRRERRRRFAFRPLRLWAYLGAASVSVLLFSWLLVRGHWVAAAATAPSNSESVAVAAGSAELSSAPGRDKSQKIDAVHSTLPSADASSKPMMAHSRPVSANQVRTVRVRQGQSLYGICSEQFGKCSPELMRKMLTLNSSIPDPDHIETGQRVSIPIVYSSAE